MGRRKRNVPVVMQMSATECGAASLSMILAYFGRQSALEEVRAACGVSRDGVRASSIVSAAHAFKLNADGYRFSLEDIKAAELPCIIHWKFNHFVVLTGFSKRYAYINDPARGSVRVPLDEFGRSYTGVAIVCSPQEGFESSGKRQSTVRFLRDRLRGMAPEIAVVGTLALLAAILSIATSVFSCVFVDRILTGTDATWIDVLVPLMIGVAVVQCAVGALSATYLLRAQGKLALVASSGFMWHLLRLPESFFDQRRVGDLQQRQNTCESIAATAVERLAPAFVNIVLLVLYLVVMLRYSVVLSLMGIASVAANLAMARYISNRRINVTRAQMADSSKLYSTTVSGISLIETIKSSGAELNFFQRWSGYQANVNEANVRMGVLNRCLGQVPVLVTQLANVAVLAVGVVMVVQGHFTVGMLLAFQGFLANFTAPCAQLVSFGQSVQEMRASVERVQDVLQCEPDPLADPLAGVPFEGGREKGVLARLEGTVEMRGVTFGYSPLEPALIHDVSFAIEPGRSLAVVGASGCGKSTVGKLLCGLYRPWEGTVLYDGVALDDVDPLALRESVAMVDQDIVMFEDTVSDNVSFWDTSRDFADIVAACKDAALADDIMARPGGYYARIAPNGRNFSGGQLQRMEIARALAQDPSVLVLDEATSALDAKTERAVMDAVRARGITCVVIAHRLSAIRDCDQIIVLDKGSVVERGTHDELMEIDGAYARLVRND